MAFLGAMRLGENGKKSPKTLKLQNDLNPNLLVSAGGGAKHQVGLGGRWLDGGDC